MVASMQLFKHRKFRFEMADNVTYCAGNVIIITSIVLFYLNASGK